jgi:general secretion pathway protein A
MYVTYWNLRERPFQNVADPRYAYLSAQHKEGLARMLYLVEEEKLGGTLVGPYGVGKSMVMELLADKIRNRPGTLYIQLDAPPVNTLAFARQFLARLGHRQHVEDLAAALDVIQAFFAEDNPALRHLVLTIDEAQLLREAATYEFLHLLSNLRARRHDGAPRSIAITLLLCGHNDLLPHLAAEPSLAQRFQFHWRLEPLGAQQVVEYVQYRVRASGGDSWLFHEEALRDVHRASQGLPRLINNLCDTALLIGCAARAPRITSAIIQQAMAEVQSPLADVTAVPPPPAQSGAGI